MPMTAETRVPDYRAPKGGSSNLQFYFEDTATHQSYLDYVGDAVTTAAIGWKRLFRDLSGGSISYNRETEDVKNEGDEKVATLTETNEMVIANGVMGTDSEAILGIEWLEDNPVPARYPLPVNPDGTYDTSTPGSTIGQLFGFYEVTARKNNRSLPTQRDQQRAMEVELVATKAEGYSRIFEVAEVDLDSDQTDWPAKMNAFKDTPA